MNPGSDCDLEKLEIQLLLEGIFRRYGHDFRDYSYASIRRRIGHRVRLEGLSSVTALTDRALREPDTFHRLLGDLSISVTEMFRDPDMFRVFREQAVPALRKASNIRIWHAGCSTGEEAYSTAILLHEEGLLDKTRIYATDMNEASLRRAKEGVIPIDRMKQYTKNYQLSGGEDSLSNYYESDDRFVVVKPFLLQNITFARHNLVTDGSFNEFHVIFCRNVLIYFNSTLRDRAHKLFHESLADGGFLVVGGKESLSFTPMADRYETVSDVQRIFRKIR